MLRQSVTFEMKTDYQNVRDTQSIRRWLILPLLLMPFPLFDLIFLFQSIPDCVSLFPFHELLGPGFMDNDFSDICRNYDFVVNWIVVFFNVNKTIITSELRLFMNDGARAKC